MIQNKKTLIAIVLVLFMLLCVNLFAQAPFEVQKSGQGKSSIIFIPGFASSGEVWNDTKTGFEKDHTCYVLTMPGFAGAKPSAESSFANWEKAIATYIKDNHLEKTTIVGHSMGGGLALALAADYPQLIGKIVVVDALPCLGALMNPSFKTEEKPNCEAMTSKITAMSEEQFYQMQKASMAQLIENKDMQETVVGWSVKSDRKTFGNMYCDFSNTDLRPKLKNIQCSALVLLEANFAGFGPAIEAQYKDLKTAKLQYAGKGLHFIMYDDKEWYLEQLKNFIRP